MLPKFQKPVPVLIPRTLTIDKLVALVLYVRWLSERIFWSLSDAIESGEIMIFFDGEDNVPRQVIDIDVIQKYHGVAGSATEMAYQETGLDLPGLVHLVSVINENNRTGYLKSAEFSLAFLIREVFNVGAENPSKDRRIGCIDAIWPAVEIYLQAAAKDEDATTRSNNPFTLKVQKELMQIAGLSAETQREIAETWTQAFEKVQKARVRASERAQVLEPHQVFDVPIEGDSEKLEGHVLRSDNTRIASEYFRGCKNDRMVVLVTVRKSGHVAIFCRGEQDFSELHGALMKAERGSTDKWHLETRNPSPMLLNGSTSRHADPTSLRLDEIVSLIQRHHRHRSRRLQVKR